MITLILTIQGVLNLRFNNKDLNVLSDYELFD